MSYVVQQPGSLTNPSNLYRVVDFCEWFDKANTDKSPKSYGDYTTYGEAETKRDQLNQDEEIR